MDVIGIIAEYNPFHNGHLYHINKIKEMYPNSIIVAVISSCFTEKGDVSVLNKWDKTKICLDNNIDIVVELPFVFSSQSADIFSYGALKILNELHVNKIVFGSESNDVDKLTCLAKEQINNKEYDLKVKKYLDEGFNYPTALSKALSSDVNTPNDILGICYIKEILKNNYNISPITIKRTNDFHSKTIKNNIISATAIRCLIKDNKDIKKYVPKEVVNYIYKNTDIYDFLKYKIISDCKILNTYKTVDEGIENRILKYIDKSKTIDELQYVFGLDNFKACVHKNSTNGIFKLIDNKLIDEGEYVLVGCCTDICVMQLALALKTYGNEYNKDIKVKVIEDACDTYHASYHDRNEYEKAGKLVMSVAGVEIAKLDDYLK